MKKILSFLSIIMRIILSLILTILVFGVIYTTLPKKQYEKLFPHFSTVENAFKEIEVQILPQPQADHYNYYANSFVINPNYEWDDQLLDVEDGYLGLIIPDEDSYYLTRDFSNQGQTCSFDEIVNVDEEKKEIKIQYIVSTDNDQFQSLCASSIKNIEVYVYTKNELPRTSLGKFLFNQKNGVMIFSELQEWTVSSVFLLSQ